MENVSLEIVKQPGEEYGLPYRFWQGCPTILRTRGGTLFAGWYSGGSKEPSPDQYNILARSVDDGKTWEEPLLVIRSIPEQKIRSIDIQLWLDPQGRMWLFWCRRDDHFRQDDPRHMFTWALICENPDEPLLRWSAPREIAPGFLRCQPTMLSDGRILLCSYDWTDEFYHYSESADGGENWIRRKGGRKLSAKFDETMVLELRNHELLMFARSEQQCIARSVSRDGGRSWSDGARTDLVAPSSRFFIARLPSGSVLRISNNHPEERRNLTAFLSDDDCWTWKYSLLLDEREPVSYPDAAMSSDGTIRILYDRGRTTDKEILFARISEEDIRRGAPGDQTILKHLVSKAPTRPYDGLLFQQEQERDEQWLEQYKLFNRAGGK